MATNATVPSTPAPNTAFLDTPATKISYTAFEVIIWITYTFALVMAIIRTSFRIKTFGRIDADDCFLILATITLTGAVALVHVMWPLILEQNQSSLGQYPIGPEFPEQMLMAIKLETPASTLTWATIYAVKYSYLLFFRNLLQRAPKMMLWWWIVLVLVTAFAAASAVTQWIICPHYTIDFFNYCSLDQIYLNERVWLITTCVTDIVGDALIITIPAMILWKVKIALRAKLGIAAALCLSLFMMIIAIVRVSFGELAPGLSDTIWIYFWLVVEGATAVFMVSATAFRSTFGHHRSSKTNNRSHHTQPTPLDTFSSKKGDKPTHGRPRISGTQPEELSDNRSSLAQLVDDEHSLRKTIYQPEVEEKHENEREMV